MSFSAFTGAPSLKLAWDEPPEIDAKMGDGVDFSPLLVVPTSGASAINNELTALSPDPHPIGAADSASIEQQFVDVDPVYCVGGGGGGGGGGSGFNGSCGDRGGGAACWGNNSNYEYTDPATDPARQRLESTPETPLFAVSPFGAEAVAPPTMALAGSFATPVAGSGAAHELDTELRTGRVSPNQDADFGPHGPSPHKKPSLQCNSLGAVGTPTKAAQPMAAWQAGTYEAGHDLSGYGSAATAPGNTDTASTQPGDTSLQYMEETDDLLQLLESDVAEAQLHAADAEGKVKVKAKAKAAKATKAVKTKAKAKKKQKSPAEGERLTDFYPRLQQHMLQQLKPKLKLKLKPPTPEQLAKQANKQAKQVNKQAKQANKLLWQEKLEFLSSLLRDPAERRTFVAAFVAALRRTTFTSLVGMTFADVEQRYPVLWRVFEAGTLDLDFAPEPEGAGAAAVAASSSSASSSSSSSAASSSPAQASAAASAAGGETAVAASSSSSSASSSSASLVSAASSSPAQASASASAVAQAASTAAAASASAAAVAAGNAALTTTNASLPSVRPILPTLQRNSAYVKYRTLTADDAVVHWCCGGEWNGQSAVMPNSEEFVDAIATDKQRKAWHKHLATDKHQKAWQQLLQLRPAANKLIWERQLFVKRLVGYQNDNVNNQCGWKLLHATAATDAEAKAAVAGASTPRTGSPASLACSPTASTACPAHVFVSQMIGRRFAHPQEGAIVSVRTGGGGGGGASARGALKHFRILGLRPRLQGEAIVLSSAPWCGRALREGMSDEAIRCNHLLQNMHNHYEVVLKKVLMQRLEQRYGASSSSGAASGTASYSSQ